MDTSDARTLFDNGGIGGKIAFNNGQRRKRVCFPRFKLGKN